MAIGSRQRRRTATPSIKADHETDQREGYQQFQSTQARLASDSQNLLIFRLKIKERNP